jgi:hypothetical protein
MTRYMPGASHSFTRHLTGKALQGLYPGPVRMASGSSHRGRIFTKCDPVVRRQGINWGPVKTGQRKCPALCCLSCLPNAFAFFPYRLNFSEHASSNATAGRGWRSMPKLWLGGSSNLAILASGGWSAGGLLEQSGIGYRDPCEASGRRNIQGMIWLFSR